jgi:hypothetical protein
MGSFRVGAVLGAVLLVAGCSNTEPGTATAAGTTTTTTSPTSSAPSSTTSTTTTTTTTSVSRPKSIDLRGTDGCKIINGMPGQDFGWQGTTPDLQDSLTFPGMKDCIVDAPKAALTFGVETVTNTGVQDFTAGGSDAKRQITPITVAGFPAFILTTAGIKASCFAGVDVSDGQMLYMQWRYSTPDNIPAPAELCAKVTKAAEAAMKVLGAS